MCLALVLCLGSCPRLLTHVNGQSPMFLVQFPGQGYWPGFLALVIGPVSMDMAGTVAHIVGSGYWPWLLAQAVGPCR